MEGYFTFAYQPRISPLKPLKVIRVYLIPLIHKHPLEAPYKPYRAVYVLFRWELACTNFSELIFQLFEKSAFCDFSEEIFFFSFLLELIKLTQPFFPSSSLLFLIAIGRKFVNHHQRVW